MMNHRMRALVFTVLAAAAAVTFAAAPAAARGPTLTGGWGAESELNRTITAAVEQRNPPLKDAIGAIGETFFSLILFGLSVVMVIIGGLMFIWGEGNPESQISGLVLIVAGAVIFGFLHPDLTVSLTRDGL